MTKSVYHKVRTRLAYVNGVAVGFLHSAHPATAVQVCSAGRLYCYDGQIAMQAIISGFAIALIMPAIHAVSVCVFRTRTSNVWHVDLELGCHVSQNVFPSRSITINLVCFNASLYAFLCPGPTVALRWLKDSYRSLSSSPIACCLFHQHEQPHGLPIF